MNTSLEISSEEINSIIDQAKSLNTIISILENTVSAKKIYRVSRILETIVAGGSVDLEREEGSQFRLTTLLRLVAPPGG